MTIPDSLKIGGHHIRIDISKVLEECNGEFVASENTIYICKSLPSSQREAALFHEILHVLNTTWAETQEGHCFLDSVSEQVYQVLKDNSLLK